MHGMRRGLTELLGPSSVYDEGAPRKVSVSRTSCYLYSYV